MTERLLLPTMTGSRQWIAALLLAAWLGSILHCSLEAADIDWPVLVHHHHDVPDGHNHEDAPPASTSHPSDDFSFQSGSAGLKVRCPDAWAMTERMILVLRSYQRHALAPPPRDDGALWLLKNWRFEQRAALPARAPGYFN